MEEEKHQQQLINLSKIADSLEQQRNLRILDLQQGIGTFGQVVIVENKTSKIQYVIKIISIFDEDSNVCQEKLQEAKNEADLLKQQIHPNIVKYVDQFQIKFNYFIQMEMYDKSLEQWIKEQSINKCNISKHQFISFACQTLSAIQYLHKNQLILRDLSLKNILLDKFNRIKLCDFGLIKKVVAELNLEQFKNSNPKGQMHNYFPELLNQSQEKQQSEKKEYVQNYYADIWAFGVCFYYLGGGSTIDCIQIAIKGYQDIKILDQEINQILSQILSIELDQRPTLEYLIQQFEMLKKQIWNRKNANEIYHQYLVRKECQDYGQAYQMILLCLDISPNDENYLLELGFIQFQLQFYNEAIKSYQKCLEINPKMGTCYYYLGIVYEAKGNLDEAINSYKKYLEIIPKDDNNCYYLLGVAYDNKGMIDEAIESYQKCLEVNPVIRCYHNLGFAYYNKGMIDEAINSYQKYLEINPNDENCYYNLGIAYDNKCMLDEAIESFYKCLEINPKHNCHYNLGIAQIGLGLIDDAFDSYKKYLEINPKDETCYYNLGIAYDDKGMFDKAIKLYQKAYKINPKAENCYYELGNEFMDKNKFDKSIKAFKLCYQLNPDEIIDCEQQISLCKSLQ